MKYTTVILSSPKINDWRRLARKIMKDYVDKNEKSFMSMSSEKVEKMKTYLVDVIKSFQKTDLIKYISNGEKQELDSFIKNLQSFDFTKGFDFSHNILIMKNYAKWFTDMVFDALKYE